MSEALSIRALTYRPGRGSDFAIRDVALSVPEGTVYGFLGPNGAGKTTIIRLALGMLDPDDGEIRLLGHTMPHDAHHALAQVGYVPERPHLYPALTVAETLRHHAPFYPTWDAQLASQLRDRFALAPEATVRHLSKGEVGKLMILLALAVRPRLLVLDEPTDGLDPIVRRDVLTSVVDYVAAEGASVLISSHLVHEQERICQWIGVLDHGRMVAELPMEQFRAGIKRLHVKLDGELADATPFHLLARRPRLGNVEEWVVRGWRADMSAWFSSTGAQLREVNDLDLEDSFVELLDSARGTMKEVA